MRHAFTNIHRLYISLRVCVALLMIVALQKIEFLINFYFFHFWSLCYLKWHSWWFFFVSTENDRGNSSGFTATAAFHILPVVWSPYNTKCFKINPRYADAVKWTKSCLIFRWYIYLFSKSMKIYRKHENIWLRCHCLLSMPLILTRLWHRLETKLHHNSDNRQPWKPVVVTSLLQYFSTYTDYFIRNSSKSHCRSGQALRVPGVWGSHISRQLAH
jgi:hypothetical protein